MNPDKLKNQKHIKCNHCGYQTNPTTAKRCQKCGKSLNVSLIQNSNEVTKPKPKSLDDLLLTPWTIRLLSVLVFLFVSWLIYCAFVTVSSLNKSNEIGVANSSDRSQNISPEVKLYNSIKEVPNVPEGTFNYGVSATFAALTAHGLNEAISAVHPNFRLRYTEPKDNQVGSKKAIVLLLDGQLSFTQQGSSLKDEFYRKAEQRGFKLKQIPVALDALVFCSHPDISIPGLSVEQLQDIYKGKLTNWKQVGGPDLPIVPFARDPKASNLLNQLLEKEVGQISSRVQFTHNYTEAIRQVSSTPGGIFFGGSGPIVGQGTVRPLAVAKANSKEYVPPFIEDNKRLNTAAIRDASYPLSRRLFVIVREDGTIDEAAGEAYANMLLSKEGQQIVEKAGLVPLR
ncbi:PstS family phosphate ABC transporter substrate-binding protein [Mastigocladopsis repens]|uniref:PstS family phosphate ABC transporter substrate-binding protein n=1 Tax=Mastigocladopsis repens TaxID=221287 RepID=UPI0002E2F863|nr:substrate-binding domain-containing protein [Mastigocladopsis repens]